MAHEVKNPLSGIKGSAQILSSKLDDDYSRKFLKIIIDETERLNGIVTKILTPPQKPNQENSIFILRWRKFIHWLKPNYHQILS